MSRLGNAGLAEHNDEDNLANQGDEVDEVPAPVLARITQTANSNGNTGNECHGSVNSPQEGQAGEAGDQAHNKADDPVKQESHPVALAGSGAGEVEIVGPHVNIMLHKRILLIYWMGQL